jgi:hypothetical protein
VTKKCIDHIILLGIPFDLSLAIVERENASQGRPAGNPKMVSLAALILLQEKGAYTKSV